MFNNQTILITGGTGSWGHELVIQLLEKYFPKEIRIYSRNEYQQVNMKLKFNDARLRFIIGDVKDKNTLNKAMKGIDVVFHLAALKHVPICEEHYWEAILVNIIGTQNVIECAINNRVKKVINVSSDKAVEPFNLYGITKACGERIMVNANNLIYNDCTSFIDIRGGNVLITHGSVIPLFKKQIKNNNEITVTDDQMTRFLMSKSQAINLIFEATNSSIGGEIFVMRMSAAKIETLVNVIIKLYGNPQTKIKKIGPRVGEKKHEVLVSKNEAQRTKVLGKDYFVVLPEICSEILVNRYKNHELLPMSEFNSTNTHILNEQELEEMIKKQK